MKYKYRPLYGADGQRSMLTKDIPLDDMLVDIVDNRIVSIDLLYSIPGEIGSSRRICTRIPIPIFTANENFGEYSESLYCGAEDHVPLEQGLLLKCRDEESKNPEYSSSVLTPIEQGPVDHEFIKYIANLGHLTYVSEADKLVDALHADFNNLHPRHPLAHCEDKFNVLTESIAIVDATIGLHLTDSMNTIVNLVKDNDPIMDYITKTYYDKYPVMECTNKSHCHNQPKVKEKTNSVYSKIVKHIKSLL